MISVGLAILLAVAGLSPADAHLVAARARLAADDLSGAEVAAQQAIAIAPRHGPTLMFLGQVAFRRARYDQALDLFDRAAAGVPAPAAATLAFNRGSTLFALTRYREAEVAFVEAARDPRLTGIAEVNAGLAALGAHDAAGARRHADDAAASSTATAIAAELDGLRAQIAEAAAPIAPVAPTNEALADAAYARGRALFQARRYDDAATPLAEAVRLQPNDPDLRFALALDDYRRDRRDDARVGFRAALDLGLDQEGAREARVFLDRLAGGLRAQGPGPDVRGTVGGGFDSNVSQLGESRTEVIGAETPPDPGGAFASANLDANYGLRLTDRLFLQLGYGFDQVAYQREEFDPYAFQVHTLTARGELVPVHVLHLDLSGGVDFQFTGLRAFEAFQRVATVEPQIVIDEGDHFATVARLRWQDKAAFQAEDAYYGGHRLDARVSERLKLRPVHVDLGFRHRREDIGTRVQDLGALTLTLRKKGITRTFEGTYVVPYAYSSDQILLAVTIDLPGNLSLSAEGGQEKLKYRQDSVWYGTGPLGRTRELGRQRRKDERLDGSAALTWAALDWLEVALRYDVVVNESNVSFNFDDKSFTKQLLSLEIAGEL